MDGISLKVDVAQVKQGANALDNFANSADRATGSADKFESASSSLASSMGKAKQGAIDASVGQDKLAEAYFKQIDKIKNTANATTKLLEIQKKVREDSKNLGEGNTNALLLDISASHKKAEAIQKALTTQKERFISALKEEAATMNMSKAQMLSFKAAQLGVMDQANEHIKQIEATSRYQLEAAKQEALTTQKERFISALKEEATTLNMTKVELLSYKAAQMGVLDQAEAHIKQFSLAETYKKEEAAQALLTSQKERFIASLREEVTTMNMSKAELLSYRATQLGVLDQADIYIKQLNNQANALNLAGMSHKQYQQAMRFLPMQITDVVTSLASGMPVWMIAIQQGGQIKDSFGGVSNTFKALMSLITPSKLAIAGAAGGLAVLAKAYYDATVNANELNRAIAMTGNYAGTDVGRITEDARLIAESVGNVSLAKTALSKTMEKGIFDPSEFNLIAKSAVEMEQATGKALDETINEFAKLQDAPAKTLAELNKQMHFLTQAEYDHVKALEKSGNKAEAASEAQRLYSQALADVSVNVEKNLTSLEKSIKSIKNDASNMWQSFADSDRTGSAVYAALTAALVGASLWSGKFAINSVKGSIDSVRARKQETVAAIEATKAEQAKYAVRQQTLLQHAQIRAQQLAEAEAQFKASAGTKNATSAEIALEQARRRAIATNKALEASNLSLANAQNAVVKAERSASVLGRAVGGASTALGLLGGPMGAAMLAGGALMYFYDKANQANQSAIDLADSSEQLLASMRAMNNVQLDGKIAEISKAMIELKDNVTNAENNVTFLDESVKKLQAYKSPFVDADEHLKRLEKATNDLDIAEAKLAEERERLANSTNLLNSMQLERQGQTTTVIDQITQEKRELTGLEQALDKMIRSLGGATEGKKTFNTVQLDTDDSLSQVDQLIQRLSRMNAVLAESTEAKRAFKQLEFDLTDAGVVLDGDKANQAKQLLGENLVFKALDGLNGYFDDWGGRNKEKPKPKTGGYKDSAGTSLLLEAQKRYEVLQAELRTLATQGLAYEKMTEDRKKLVELDAQSALLREKASKEGLTKEQQSILAMNDQLRAQYELNAIESERLNGRKDALQVEKSIADKMIEIRQSLIQIDGARGLSARESAVWNEKNQAKIDFERAGGNIGDLNSPATQQYLAALDLIDQKHQKIWESQRDWKSAFSTGIKDWVDDASNVVKSTDEIIDTSMNGAISNLSQALRGSVVDWKSWGVSVLSMIGEVITKLAVASAMQMALDSIGGDKTGSAGVTGSGASSIFGSIGSGLLSIFGFASGGFTGYGGKYDPAGVVHKGEFVFTKEATQKLGVSNLYSLMNTAQKGYAQGGLVGGSMPVVQRPNVDMMRSMAMGDVHVNVVVNNNGSSAEAKTSSNADGSNLGQVIGGVVREAISKELRQGGMIQVAMTNKMGR